MASYEVTLYHKITKNDIILKIFLHEFNLKILKFWGFYVSVIRVS